MNSLPKLKKAGWYGMWLAAYERNALKLVNGARPVGFDAFFAAVPVPPGSMGGEAGLLAAKKSFRELVAENPVLSAFAYGAANVTAPPGGGVTRKETNAINRT